MIPLVSLTLINNSHVLAWQWSVYEHWEFLVRLWLCAFRVRICLWTVWWAQLWVDTCNCITILYFKVLYCERKHSSQQNIVKVCRKPLRTAYIKTFITCWSKMCLTFEEKNSHVVLENKRWMCVNASPVSWCMCFVLWFRLQWMACAPLLVQARSIQRINSCYCYRALRSLI